MIGLLATERLGLTDTIYVSSGSKNFFIVFYNLIYTCEIISNKIFKFITI